MTQKDWAGRGKKDMICLGEVNGGQVPTTITGRSFGWVSIPFQKTYSHVVGGDVVCCMFGGVGGVIAGYMMV